MSNRTRSTSLAAFVCLALAEAATAAPSFQVLYHERLELTARAGSGGQQHLSFEAYGRRFELALEPNEDIVRAVPADRDDIQPLRGTIEGQPGSWVRLTRSRGAWRGVLSDGGELYAIEPAAEVARVAVQPLAAPSGSTPVMYRFADALMPPGAASCGTLPDESGSSTSDKASARSAYEALTSELITQSAQAPTRRLLVSVVADHQFTDAIGDDPEGAIIARMDIVDGIFSAQVGVKIALAPLTVFRRAPDPFTATSVPVDLLAEVSRYRGRSAPLDTGVTHLMTGRSLNGTIVGIAYVGSVCNGDTAVSLSEGTLSTTESALIAAHELAHNFNAPHDGQPGACATTPQTFLMAPRINFSNQFSECSLRQIATTAAVAQCLTDIAPPPAGSFSQVVAGGGDAGAGPGGGGRLDIVLLALLSAVLVARRACAITAAQVRQAAS